MKKVIFVLITTIFASKLLASSSIQSLVDNACSYEMGNWIKTYNEAFLNIQKQRIENEITEIDSFLSNYYTFNRTKHTHNKGQLELNLELNSKAITRIEVMLGSLDNLRNDQLTKKYQILKMGDLDFLPKSGDEADEFNLNSYFRRRSSLSMQ